MTTMPSQAPPDPPLRRKPMTPHRHAPASVGLALLGALSLAPAAGAQIAVSANDNKVVSLNGVVTVVPNAPPDTVSVIDLKASPPRVIAEVQAPVSVVGPPLSIAVTPDESLAIVTASSNVDPTDHQQPHAKTRGRGTISRAELLRSPQPPPYVGYRYTH